MCLSFDIIKTFLNWILNHWPLIYINYLTHYDFQIDTHIPYLLDISVLDSVCLQQTDFYEWDTVYNSKTKVASFVSIMLVSVVHIACFSMFFTMAVIIACIPLLDYTTINSCILLGRPFRFSVWGLNEENCCELSFTSAF